MSLTHVKVLLPGDKTVANVDKFRVRKVNKTHLLIGEIETFIDIGDELSLFCTSYRKAGNDYKLMPYKIGPAPVCKFIDGEKLLYPDFQKKTDFPDLGVCPWPARVYHINGWNPDLENLPPIVDTGDYMVECKLLREEEVLQGMQIYGSVLNIPLG